MEHEGALHGLPADPFLHRIERPDESGRWTVFAATDVVTRYISVTMEKVRKELREEVEMNGIGVLKEFIKENPEDKGEILFFAFP